MFAAPLPVRVLALPLPVALIAPPPVSVRCSIAPLAWTVSERLKVMPAMTVSVPLPPVSSATSPDCDTT